MGTHKYGAQLSFYSLVPLNVECDGVSLIYCLWNKITLLLLALSFTAVSSSKDGFDIKQCIEILRLVDVEYISNSLFEILISN